MPSSGRSSRLRRRSFRYASTGARLSSESSEWRWRSRITAALSPEHDVDAGEDQVDLPARQTTDTAGQERPVERQDLRDVGDRVLRQPGASRPKDRVARSVCPTEVAGQWNTYHGRDPAPIERVALNDEHRPAKAGTRARGRRQVGPAHVALCNYHSLRSRMRRAAAERAGSGRASTSEHTSFIASVIASGSCRARYSATASLKSALRDFFNRRARRSASAKRASGMESAVFIPEV